MQIKSITRRFIFALVVAASTALIGLDIIAAQTPIGRPPDPTPPPPTLLAPRGELPAQPVGLQEWVQYRDGPYRLAGSGFLILLSDGEVFGVTILGSSRSPGRADRPARGRPGRFRRRV